MINSATTLATAVVARRLTSASMMSDREPCRGDESVSEPRHARTWVSPRKARPNAG